MKMRKIVKCVCYRAVVCVFYRDPPPPMSHRAPSSRLPFRLLKKGTLSRVSLTLSSIACFVAPTPNESYCSSSRSFSVSPVEKAHFRACL